MRGDELLPGWYDDWAVEERDRLEQLRAEALERVGGVRAGAGRRSVGHRRGARSASEVEPLRESASELLIRALLGRDDRAGAVRELERYREVVRTELGVVPSPALVTLVEAAPVAVPVPASPRARPLAVRDAAPPPARVVVPRPRRATRAAVPHGPPPPPIALSPTGPAGSSWRATAARLAVGAALVLAASRRSPTSAPTAHSPPRPPRAAPRTSRRGRPPNRAGAVRCRPPGRCWCVRSPPWREPRPSSSAPPSARPGCGSRSPARPGSSVVRSVVVRSRDGNRLVLDGLDGGTYEWSATSPPPRPWPARSVSPRSRLPPSPRRRSRAAGRLPRAPDTHADLHPGLRDELDAHLHPDSHPDPHPDPHADPHADAHPTPSPSPQPDPPAHPDAAPEPVRHTHRPGTQDPGPLG